MSDIKINDIGLGADSQPKAIDATTNPQFDNRGLNHD